MATACSVGRKPDDHLSIDLAANHMNARAVSSCPNCDGSLQALRLDLESQCEEWDTLVDDIDRLIALRKEFDIPVDETDALKLATFGDAQRFVIERLAGADRDVGGPGSVWDRLVGAVARIPECRVTAAPQPADPFIRSPLWR